MCGDFRYYRPPSTDAASRDAVLCCRQVIIDGAAVFFSDKEARRKQLFHMMDGVNSRAENPSLLLTFQSLCQFFRWGVCVCVCVCVCVPCSFCFCGALVCARVCVRMCVCICACCSPSSRCVCVCVCACVCVRVCTEDFVHTDCNAGRPQCETDPDSVSSCCSTVDPSGLLDLPHHGGAAASVPRHANDATADADALEFNSDGVLAVMETLISVAHKETRKVLDAGESLDSDWLSSCVTWPSIKIQPNAPLVHNLGRMQDCRVHCNVSWLILPRR